MKNYAHVDEIMALEEVDPFEDGSPWFVSKEPLMFWLELHPISTSRGEDGSWNYKFDRPVRDLWEEGLIARATTRPMPRDMVE